MKFVVDAQLPIRLKSWMISKGFDVVHAIDLPNKEFSTDREISSFADAEQRIVITKDSDFYKSHIIKQEPKRLFFITTGNINNNQLIALLELNMEVVSQRFLEGKIVIELNNESVIVHQ